MKDRKIFQDKMAFARVKPSEKVWGKIEKGLEKEYRIKRFKNRSLIGWAAAFVILVFSYFIHRNDVNTTAYMPEILELNDYDGELDHWQNVYHMQKVIPNFRIDGRLVPNYKTIWENPLVPREVNF